MKRYIPLIFMEGATVMAVELCGAKLLAPLYGGSLFVWAAILAVTLAGLAFGYYYGGVLSSKSEPKKKLFRVLIIASIFTVLMPLINDFLVFPVSYIDFKAAVILSAVMLILLPVFFLGCTTPLLVRINTTSPETSGLITGRVYAISTIGGIVSTLLCGFFLIPDLGLSGTLMGAGSLLFLISIVTLKIYKDNLTMIFLVTLLLSPWLLPQIKDEHIKSRKSGIMGDILVADRDSVRRLYINKTVQTEMDLRTKHSVSDYVHSLDTLIRPVDKNRKKKKESGTALVLGLGGGLVANMLLEKGFDVDAVEFDPRITHTAKEFFDLNPNIKCYDQDARAFINTQRGHALNIKNYNYIILDLFKGEEQPSHVITTESFEKLFFLLDENGSMIINWHGYIDGELGEGTQILLNTLHYANFRTKIVSGAGSPDHRNVLIVCEKGESAGIDHELVINTDDQPVIELANAKANLRWRRNYLRYYQSLR